MGVIQKQLKCDECGNINNIWRRCGRNRERGHTKHMYCYVCKSITAHIELDEFKDSCSLQLIAT